MRTRAIALLAFVLPACGNECDFFVRCDGNRVLTCGGVDQIVHRRVHVRTCEPPNGRCVLVDERSATCAR